MASFLMTMLRMILFGSTPLADNTRPSRHTRRNFLVQLNPLWSIPCGRLGLPPKSSSSHGWRFKTGFGLRIGWKSVDGQTAASALSASGNRSPWTICSTNAASPSVCGDSSKIGSSLCTLILSHGILHAPLKIGGWASLTLRSPIEKRWRRSPCSSHGPSGMRGMHACFVRKVLRRRSSLATSRRSSYG